ncbi:hypothetical protein HN51_063071 [Arachis hypogaea]|uniref:Protein kinase domain-containing protein n=1 Tax=Arachis hypogaea TaxID=3818 RepID=A0A445AZI0_ARAHY|nr:protein IMPAIRED IN BABA-INDUCED STERILITY 1 [Arachis hypogaea]QHO20636.1 putative serine/threonine-protein kinase [Arachis hypogaea]RYR31852.1 hypothetical protein Ahy_B01g056782 [Arachis hypogaea]
MGCVVVKQGVSVTPAGDHSAEDDKRRNNTDSASRKSELSDSSSFRLVGNLQKYVEGEQAAAGWPAWLSSVAAEAIQGWVPLRADAFEKLEKIGQGTYSSVFRAKELETGKIVALKKVRFDNFEPESVRFMAREIMILRRLDHPNIIKLEGLITSRLSCSIYLVFEYMQHDITGLLSRPEIKFNESQIKCYMKQLLSGLEHCHSKGVMHRDIKGSNLLVNDEGILKVADFGLANWCNSGNNKQPLTSRVVTLWYRPPELLLGSTDYSPSVDLWSVGCVFAELLIGKPILQGRTEVEQLHKIFKLCGSPPDDYWKKTKLPHATLFKPQQPYDSSLWETFKDLPATSINVLQTLLSVEPSKRGTATSALSSEYFKTKPYACDPSSMPIYPPSKEIDAKHQEESKRKKISGRACRPESRKPSRKPLALSKLAPAEDLTSQIQTSQRQKVDDSSCQVLKEENIDIDEEAPKLSSDKPLEQDGSHMKDETKVDIPFPGPLQVSKSSGFAWAKRRKDDTSIRAHSRSISRGHLYNSLETSTVTSRNNSESRNYENKEFCGGRSNSRGRDLLEISKLVMQNQWNKFDRPDSFDTSDEYHSQELSMTLYHREDSLSKRSNLSSQDQGDTVDFSGPLISQMHTVDEILERHERHIRRTVRRSWFQKDKKNGK